MKLRNKIILLLLAIFAMTVGAVFVYYARFQDYFNTGFKSSFVQLENSDLEPIEADKPLTILLMGVDMDQASRGGKWEGGRSDSMILVTINPKTKKTLMVSLSRDLMVEIAKADGTSSEMIEKLNHSYAYGQAAMAKATVEKMLDVEIDRYIQINMDGLMDLVDAIDGIQVTNPFDFPISISEHEPQYTAKVAPGTHTVNGAQALVFSRMRYDDPDGDSGRQRRQQEVIRAILGKLTKLESMAQYKTIIDKVSENLQTDIPITTDSLPILLGYAESLKHIESAALDGDGQMIQGVSYQIATAQEVLDIQNKIKRSLGKKPSDQLRTNLKVFELLYGGTSETSVIDAYTGEEALHGELSSSSNEESYSGGEVYDVGDESEASYSQEE